MKIVLCWIGKTQESYLRSGIDIYLKRLRHYCALEILEYKDVKTVRSNEELRLKEAEVITNGFKNTDLVVLLDEKGKQMDSISLSKDLQKWLLQSSYKRIIFVIAGAYGAGDKLKQRADFTWSLSNLTFSHQMIRLFLSEQIYRAFTILKNEKYHNP